MDISHILSELKSERDRLDRAIAALEGAHGGPGRKSGNGRRTRHGRRHMSADARRRISEAMRKKWAERKRAKQ